MRAWLMRDIPASTAPVRPVYQENIFNDYVAPPRTPYLPLGKNASACSTPATAAAEESHGLENMPGFTLKPVPQQRAKRIQRKTVFFQR